MTKNGKIFAGCAAAAGAFALWRYSQLATGDARLDRIGIRGRALRWGLELGVPSELLLAIARQEGTAWLNPEIGDTGDDRGPSVGPLEVLRETAIADGFVPADTDSDAYSKFADPSQEGLTFGWGAKHFAKLYAANGQDAYATFTDYNGSSDYADNATAWLQQTFPSKYSAA